MMPEREVVGIIPAAGHASRLSPLPCSKEVYPLGFDIDGEGNVGAPRAVCLYLLEKFRLAGVDRVYIVLRKGKWDIPSYLGDGGSHGVNIAYLIQGLPYGEPYTVNQAYPFVKDEVVAFGYPDVLFEPDDAYIRLLSRLALGGSDMVLGVFPADRPEKVDMIDFDDGRVRRIVIKPERTDLRYAWGIAVWTPAFTRFMHDYLDARREAPQHELSMGDVVQAAVDEGLSVEGLRVSNKPLLDIGTGDDLLRALKRVVDRTEPRE